MFNKIQQSTQKIAATKSQKLSLTQGQLFQGRILKFFPNNIAALQLGSRTVSARLEAPLTAGETYWLEVVKADGVPQLKVVDDNAIRQNGQNPQTQVLQHLGIPANKTNQLLMHHLAAEQISFTKEGFEKAAHLLQQTGLNNKEGLQILTILLQKNLPLTLESFHSIKALESSQVPLLQQVDDLYFSLQQLEKKNPSLRPYMTSLQNISAEMQIPAGKHPLLHLLLSAASQTLSKDIHEGAARLLQKVGLMAESSSTDQLFEAFKARLLDPVNQPTISKLWPFLNQSASGEMRLDSLDGKMIFQVLYPRLEQPATKEQQQYQLQLLLQLFQSKASAGHLNQQLMDIQHLPNLSKQEREAFSFMWSQTVSNEQQGERTTLAAQLIQIVNKIGYFQERELVQHFQGKAEFDASSQGERLKSLLLQLNQLQLSPAMKEKVELLLHRITGQQLIAQEQHGILQQAVLQIPLQLGEWQTELTIQWEGKKKANGTIDPDHCRILFYLDLARLKETIVDVQIQQKIVSVQVYNENERPNVLINSLQPFLKKQLLQLGYTLTAVKWVQFKEQPIQKTTTVQKGYSQWVGYEGVDVRI